MNETPKIWYLRSKMLQLMRFLGVNYQNFVICWCKNLTNMMSDDNCYPWDGMKGHILPCSPSQCMATFTFHWSLHRHDDHQMFSTVLTDCKFLIQNRILPKVFILNCAAQRQVSLRCRNHINRHCHRLRDLASNTKTPTHKFTVNCILMPHSYQSLPVPSWVHQVDCTCNWSSFICILVTFSL